MLDRNEGGVRTQINTKEANALLIRDVPVPGSLSRSDGDWSLTPGERAIANCELELPIALEIGTRFCIRKKKRTIGIGIVTQLPA